MVNFSVATNFDDRLLMEIGELNKQHHNKVTEVYGSLPCSVIGSGRAQAGLPKITYENLVQHIKKTHDYGLRFSYLINANAGIKSTDSSYIKSVKTEIERLLSAGADSLTIAHDFLIHLVRAEYRDVEMHLSLIAGVSTVEDVQRYADKGVRVIALNQHTVNRDFKRIEDIVQSTNQIELRLYANVSCLDGCPKRNEHYEYLSSQSQSGNIPFDPRPDHYIINCALTYLKNPEELLRSPFIRPEDIKVYEDLGIQTFKLSDRREPTTALVNLVRAYLTEEFKGNLFGLLFRDGRKWTNSFTAAGLQYPPTPNIVIDNAELSRMRFLDNIRALSRKELDQFYREATSLAVSRINSPQTKKFKRWLSNLKIRYS